MTNNADRHRIGRMCAKIQWRRMIWQGHQTPGLPAPLQMLQQRAENETVDVLQRLDLTGGVALVRALVRSLNMDSDQIKFVQSGHGGGRFTGIIRVQITGCAGNVYNLPADAAGNASYQVHRRNGRALNAESLRKRTQGRPKTLPPEPYLRRGPLTQISPHAVNLMVFKQCAAIVHQGNQIRGIPALWQVLGNRLTKYVVRRSGPQIQFTVTAMNQQVPIPDAGKKLPIVARQSGRHVSQQSPALRIGYAAGRVINHLAVNHGHKIAAQNQIIIGQLNLLGQSLQRSPTRINLLRVVTQCAQYGYVASGSHAFRNIAGGAKAALTGNTVK